MIASISFNRFMMSSRFAVTISAAAEGVGARTSAARSERVVSISCPTAEMTGIFDSATRPYNRLVGEGEQVL